MLGASAKYAGVVHTAPLDTQLRTSHLPTGGDATGYNTEYGDSYKSLKVDPHAVIHDVGLRTSHFQTGDENELGLPRTTYQDHYQPKQRVPDDPYDEGDELVQYAYL